MTTERSDAPHGDQSSAATEPPWTKEFGEWWYDYCVKNDIRQHGKGPKWIVALDAWNAARLSEIGPIDPEFIKAVQDTRYSNEWVGIAFRNRLYTNTLYAAPQPPVSEGAGSNTACHPAAESASSSRCVVEALNQWRDDWCESLPERAIMQFDNIVTAEELRHSGRNGE